MAAITILQIFSAKSIDGVRAYELARRQYREKGLAKTEVMEDFDHSAAQALHIQKINIYDLELLRFDPSYSGSNSPADPDSRINVADTSGLHLPLATIRISCSKGTYIRAFARDLGEALGTGAHLDALRRTRSGAFCIENALSLSDALSLL